MRLCQPLPCHNVILVSALHLVWPRYLASPPTRLGAPSSPLFPPWPNTHLSRAYTFSATCWLSPVPAEAQAFCVCSPPPRCRTPPMLPVHIQLSPCFPLILSLHPCGAPSDPGTPSQVRTRLFTCTHRPLAKAAVPWPSRLRGNQFIGILGWGARTKGALFKFM